MVTDDLAYVDGLPTFHKMMSEGSVIRNVLTIYPTLTHCVHASIITGKTAGETGITANTMFTPGETAMPWYNKYDDIKCDTIFKFTKKAGLKTAVCRWPVTANAGDNIDYLVPEVMEKDLEDAGGDIMKAYANIGTSECLMDIVEAAIKKCGGAISHPVADESQVEMACDIIKRYKPNLLFTHPGYVDSERHRTGLFSPYVLKSLDKTEEWITRMVEATKEAGIYENTDFIILSDHGHCQYHTFVMPNVKLVEEGLIKLDAEGRVEDWSAYVQSCDLSAYVYLKNSDDKAVRARVEELLNEWVKDEKMGVESYMTVDEAKAQYGLYGGFGYVLEARDGYHFEDDFTGPLTRENPPVEPGLGHSAHGHMPHKGPQPVFIGCGPHFAKGEVVENGSILEHFGTIRRVLGI